MMEEKKAQDTCKKTVNNYEISFTFSDIQIEVEAHTDRESYYYKSIILHDELPVTFKQAFENLQQVFTTIKQSENNKISFQDGSFKFIVLMGKNNKEIELIALKKYDYTLIQLQAHLKIVVEQKDKNLQTIVDQKNKNLQTLVDQRNHQHTVVNQKNKTIQKMFKDIKAIKYHTDYRKFQIGGVWVEDYKI